MARRFLHLSLVLTWIPFTLHVALGDRGVIPAVFHALTGWWAPLAGVVAVACLAMRAWREAAAAAPLLVLWAAWSLPGTLFGPRPAEGRPLRVVSANVLMVHPDPDALRDEILSFEPDVVVLQEVSARWVASFAGASGDYPYQVWLPAEDSFGQAVLSRRPLLQQHEWTNEGVPMLEVLVEVDGVPVRLVDVHTLPPRTALYAEVWERQLEHLVPFAGHSRAEVIVAGDLNATRYHPSYRRLLAETGLRDAHAAVGRAAAWTWPNGIFPVPPMRLDHVLVSEGIAVVGVAEGRALGSDHRPVVVDVVVRGRGARVSSR